MRQWASIMGWRWRAGGSMRGRPTVSNLSTVECAPHCGSPGEAGGWCGG